MSQVFDIVECDEKWKEGRKRKIEVWMEKKKKKDVKVVNALVSLLVKRTRARETCDENGLRTN